MKEQVQLFIPSICKIGFNLREGTYTGRLSYIIYFDGKEWRKEPSWKGWIQEHTEDEQLLNSNKCTSEGEIKYINNSELSPFEFNNVPTSGFVLNKKVGGDRYGYNPRQTYIRVYDPRGWEFEITPTNLLFILENTNSYKGKGLEGEFVYSWDGKDLILCPVDSYNYTQSTIYTKLQSGKVSSKDLVEGCTYETNKQVKLVYIGKYDFYKWSYDWKDYCSGSHELKKKQFVFFNEETNKYINFSSLTNIKQKVNDTIHTNISYLIDNFINHSVNSSEFKQINYVNINDTPLTKGMYMFYNNGIYEIDNKNYIYNLISEIRDGNKYIYLTSNYQYDDKLSVTNEELKQGKLIEYEYENGYKHLINIK